MLERLTERARQVVVLAHEEARSLRHNYIGTEHILLGLVRENESVAPSDPARLRRPPAPVRGEANEQPHDSLTVSGWPIAR